MGTVTFSGLASGIDSDSIIQATIDSRRVQELPLKNTVSFNDQETTALEEFNTKLLSLVDTLKEFTTAYGGAVTKTAYSSNSDVIGVEATNGAPNISSTVTVTQLAKAGILSFNDRFSSIDQLLAPNLTSPEIFEVTVGKGENAHTVSIEITNETTLTNLVDAINGASEETLQASIVNTGTETAPQYLLLLNGVDTGLEKGELSVTVPEQLKNQGLFNSYTLEQASDAKLQLAGVGEITRATNKISDLIPGMSLELKQATGTPIQLSIGVNNEKSSEKIAELITQINEIITYAGENNKIERTEEDGKVSNVFSSLAKTRVDDNAIRAIQAAFSETRVSSDSGVVNVLSDLGITINRDGTYTFNQQKFADSIKKDPSATQQLVQGLADKLASSNGVISEYTRYEGQISLALKTNQTENERLNEKLERMEEQIEKQAAQMRLLYSRLEENMAKMQAESNSLLSILGIDN